MSFRGSAAESWPAGSFLPCIACTRRDSVSHAQSSLSRQAAHRGRPAAPPPPTQSSSGGQLAATHNPLLLCLRRSRWKPLPTRGAVEVEVQCYRWCDLLLRTRAPSLQGDYSAEESSSSSQYSLVISRLDSTKNMFKQVLLAGLDSLGS
jgi:hypothetical protein